MIVEVFNRSAVGLTGLGVKIALGVKDGTGVAVFVKATVVSNTVSVGLARFLQPVSVNIQSNAAR